MSTPHLLHIVTDATLTDTECRVLLYLMLTSMNQKHREIGDALGKSERTVRRALNRMDQRHVETERRGWHRANCYRLNCGTKCNSSIRPDTDDRTAVASSSQENEKTLTLKGTNADTETDHRGDGALDDGQREVAGRGGLPEPDHAHGSVATEARVKESVRTLIARNPANDVDHTLRIITRTLERGGCGSAWPEYLQRIERVTTSPERCGAGHFVARAQELCREAAAAIRRPVQYALESARCGECGGIGRVGPDFCSCLMGRDLQRVERRKTG